MTSLSSWRCTGEDLIWWHRLFVPETFPFFAVEVCATNCEWRVRAVGSSDRVAGGIEDSFLDAMRAADEYVREHAVLLGYSLPSERVAQIEVRR